MHIATLTLATSSKKVASRCPAQQARRRKGSLLRSAASRIVVTIDTRLATVPTKLTD
jgi:hypothetical protein